MGMVELVGTAGMAAIKVVELELRIQEAAAMEVEVAIEVVVLVEMGASAQSILLHLVHPFLEEQVHVVMQELAEPEEALVQNLDPVLLVPLELMVTLVRMVDQ